MPQPNVVQRPRPTQDRMDEIRRVVPGYSSPGPFSTERAAMDLIAEVDALTAEIDAVTRERDEARKDSTRLEYLRANGMIRVAGADGMSMLNGHVRSLDALREAIDGYIDDDINDTLDTFERVGKID